MSDAWRSLCDAVMEASDAAFDPVAFVDNEATDTQVWLFWSRARRQVVVAFRGTEQSSWKDILTDISLTPVALHTQRMADSPRSIPLAELSAEPGPVTRMLNSVERAKEEAAIVRRKKEEQVKAEAASSSEEESEKKEGNGHVLEGTAEVVSAAVEAVSTVASELQEVLSRVKRIIDEGEASAAALPATEAWVHSGFLGAYDSVRSAVLGLVDATLAGEDTSQWSVVLTGHSLGGALATLCAHDLAHRTWSAPPRLVMYNYGSPRLGNKVFAAEFNRAVPNAWRVVNNNDAVVTVPRLMGYCHVGHAVILGAGGAMEIQRDTSEAPFEGVAVPEVLPAVGAVITAAVSSAVPAIMEAAGREIALATRSSSDEDGGEAGEVGSGTNVLAQQKEEAAAAESGLGADQLSVLWEQEKAAWTTLLQGQSMSEHMEDFYFEAINQAVKEWKARAANEQMEGKQNGAAAESKGGRIGASDGEENEQHMVQHTEETRE